MGEEKRGWLWRGLIVIFCHRYRVIFDSHEMACVCVCISERERNREQRKERERGRYATVMQKTRY